MCVRQFNAALDCHAQVAEQVDADTIKVHGGAYGDKVAALQALRRSIEHLPAPVRSRMTLENDDKLYTPADLRRAQ
jgi:UV DNA damage endonuclease